MTLKRKVKVKKVKKVRKAKKIIRRIARRIQKVVKEVQQEPKQVRVGDLPKSAIPIGSAWPYPTGTRL